MEFKTYQPLALRTAKMFNNPQRDLRHAALGLITELGEFASEIKRIEVYGRERTPEMVKHMCEELGDTMWYIPLALFALNVDTLPECTEEQFVFGDNVDIADLTLALSCFSKTTALQCLNRTVSADMVWTIVNELAALVWLIDHKIAPMLGTNGDMLRAENIAKLMKRYPEAYSDQAAEARADKGGLDHLNS